MISRCVVVGAVLCVLLEGQAVCAAEAASKAPNPALVMLPAPRPALAEVPSEATLPATAPAPIGPETTLPAPAAPRVTAPLSPARPLLAEAFVTRGKSASGPRVTFPRDVVTANAIRLMATGQVPAGRNRCARTMRHALGWGLGDAHQWLSLEEKGFSRRAKSAGPEPGDIVVWPFTFGSRRSQHIGIAVQTDNGMRLLSNLSGTICLSAMVPGYAAFYKPLPTPAPADPAPVAPAPATLEASRPPQTVPAG